GGRRERGVGPAATSGAAGARIPAGAAGARILPFGGAGDRARDGVGREGVVVGDDRVDGVHRLVGHREGVAVAGGDLGAVDVPGDADRIAVGIGGAHRQLEGVVDREVGRGVFRGGGGDGGRAVAPGDLHP